MKILLSISLLFGLFFLGCNSSTSTQEKPKGQITTAAQAQEAISYLNSMNLNLITGGLTQSIPGANSSSPSKVSAQATSDEYPKPYDITRDCKIDGSADTNGTQTSATHYHVYNRFNQCQEFNALIVDGLNTVDADFKDNLLTAVMTENELQISVRNVGIMIFANTIYFQSDAAFKELNVSLNGDAYLFDDTDEIEIDFNDFNVSLDTNQSTAIVNGAITFNVCEPKTMKIETLVPVVVAPDGSFSSGKLLIDGATFEYLDDNRVLVTFPDGTQGTYNNDVTVSDMECPDDMPT